MKYKITTERDGLKSKTSSIPASHIGLISDDFADDDDIYSTKPAMCSYKHLTAAFLFR